MKFSKYCMILHILGIYLLASMEDEISGSASTYFVKNQTFHQVKRTLKKTQKYVLLKTFNHLSLTFNMN